MTMKLIHLSILGAAALWLGVGPANAQPASDSAAPAPADAARGTPPPPDPSRGAPPPADRGRGAPPPAGPADVTGVALTVSGVDTNSANAMDPNQFNQRGRGRRNNYNTNGPQDNTRNFNRQGNYGPGGYGPGGGGYGRGGGYAPGASMANGAGGEFAIISDNNIFDSSRFKRVIPPPRPPTAVRYYFGLLGTMSYSNEAYAFFSDSRISGNNRAFALNETINSFKITTITNDYINLLSPSNEVIKLEIGRQMSHTNNGAWQLVPSTDRASASSSDSTASTASESSDTAPDVASSSGAPEGDIAKKLWLRRQAELGGGSGSNDSSGNPPTPTGDTNQ